MRVINLALFCAALSLPAVYGNYAEDVTSIHHSITNYHDVIISGLDTAVQSMFFSTSTTQGGINFITKNLDAVASAPQIPFMQGLVNFIILTEEDAESINIHLKNFISSQTAIIFNMLPPLRDKIRAVTNNSTGINNVRTHLLSTAISQEKYADAFIAIAPDVSKQMFIDYKANVDVTYQSAIANYTE